MDMDQCVYTKCHNYISTSMIVCEMCGVLYVCMCIHDGIPLNYTLVESVINMAHLF